MTRLSRFRSASLVFLLTIPVVASCGDSTGPPPVGTIVPQGAAVSGRVGSTVTVRVMVNDESGNPIDGIEVRFSTTSGSVAPTSVETASGGLAQTAWTLGTTAGNQTLQVTAGSKSLSVTALAEPGTPAKLEAVSGDGQTGVVRSVLGVPVTVRVNDQFDNPVSGVSVSFSTAAQGASANPSTTPTGSDGRASTSWTLGRTAGSQTLEARAGAAGSTTFTATATPGPAAQVVVVSGDDQEAQVGETLPEPLVAEVQDEFGNEIQGASVQFQPGEGSGSVGSPTAQSDADGRVQTSWTLGQTSGEQTVVATLGQGQPATFTATADPGPPTALVKVSGDGQVGVVGGSLSDLLVVKVQDEFGNGVPGEPVQFTVIAGGGSLSPASGTTGTDGAFSTTWNLGSDVGAQTVAASSGSLPPVQFDATAVQGEIQLVRGDGQTTATGTPVPIPPRVRVVTGQGNPVPGKVVTFQVAGGGGAVQGGVQTTDADGLATVDEWVLGGGAGENTLTVSGTGLTEATFTATGEAVGETYDIEVRFVGDPPEVYAQAFLDAEAKWERIIVEGLPEQPVNIAAGACGLPHSAVNETIDDLVLFVQLDSIDGPGAILGRAGPCVPRDGSPLTSVGVMQFDTADLATFNDRGQLDEIVVHEMAHTMGFIPVVWTALGLNADVGGPDSRFLGAGAIARFEAVGGQPQGAVPLETNFGPGSDDSHWDEDLFGPELMTPAINNGANPLSAITVAAMWDMGYVVDIGQAEAYALPGAGLWAGGGHTGVILRELPPGPILDPRGRPYDQGSFNRSRDTGSGPPALPGPGRPGGPR